MSQATECLLYGFDPLCGWCFAFRPTMRAIREAFPDLPVTIKMGGLVTGGRVEPIARQRNYLVNGLEQVRRASGVVAGNPFYTKLLAEGTYISDSEPPCRAIYVAQQIAPEQAYDFADALSEAFYVHGLRLDNEGVLSEIARTHAIDGELLLEQWRGEEAKRGLHQAFMQNRASGFTSYPTLLYQRDEHMQLVAQGFAPPADGVARVSALRQQRQIA